LILAVRDISSGDQTPTLTHGIILGKEMLMNSKVISAKLVATVFRISPSSQLLDVVKTALNMYTPKNPVRFVETASDELQFITNVLKTSKKV